MRGLWRRIVFNVLVSNTDDHLRNHGFLYGPGVEAGDVRLRTISTPCTRNVRPRVLSVAITLDDPTASLSICGGSRWL